MLGPTMSSILYQIPRRLEYNVVVMLGQATQAAQYPELGISCLLELLCNTHFPTPSQQKASIDPK